MAKLANEAGTVQYPLVRHAEEVGWIVVSQDEALRSRLKKVELERLGDAVTQSRSKTIEDVERWSMLADLSTSRAGLLLVSDVELARGALAREGQLPSDLSVKEQMKHLVVFAVFEGLRVPLGSVGVHGFGSIARHNGLRERQKIVRKHVLRKQK